MDKKISVILADDHSIVRKGISLVLENDDQIEIIGQASDGKEAFKMVEELKPDVLVADISMPEVNGIELTKLISEQDLPTNTLILSTHFEEEYILKSFDAGASGYLPKDADEEEVISAIRTISEGDIYYTPEVSQILAQSVIKKNKKELGENKELTEREIEVLQLVVDGLSNKEIADKLFISVRTVDTHRRNLMEKLEAKNTAELVRKAFEKKLVGF